MDPAPFRRLDGGTLLVDDVHVEEIVAQLDGRPAVVVSEAAVRRAARACGPRVVDAGAVDADEVLAALVDEGWWVRLRSSHDVGRAVAAGVPVERRVAGGGVRDDGFLKDALAAGVGAIEHDDDVERSNAERVAAHLGGGWPDDDVAPPPDAPADAFAGCAGLLAAVLGDHDGLRIDAPWPVVAAPREVVVLPLEAPADAPSRATSLVGLGPRDARSTPATVLGHTPRGSWVAVPLADGLSPPRVDASHAAPERALVRGALRRILTPRPWPGRPEA